jgi:hypothetical protein
MNNKFMNNKLMNNKFSKRLKKYSNPIIAQKKAYKYLGKTAKLYQATNSKKKYSIYDKKNKKWVNFGQMGFQDFTRHKDHQRRKNYLKRSKKIRGDWKRNKYSPNNLSIHVLW